MTFGMPTLIELNGIEENVRLANELGLDFVEINMNLPEFQPERMNVKQYKEIADKYNIDFTLHLHEEFDPAIFNKVIRDSHLKVFGQAVELAKNLDIPIINMHMNKGIHFSLPNEKILLYEKYVDDYLSSIQAFRSYLEECIGDYNVMLCIENTGIYNYEFIRKATEILLKSAKVKLTWDIGHDYSSGNCDKDFIHSHLNSIYHMHLHDAIGTKNHLPLFVGDINILEKIEKVKVNKTRYVIETKTVEGLKSSVASLREKL